MSGIPRGIEGLKVAVWSSIRDAFILSKLVGARGLCHAWSNLSQSSIDELSSLIPEWTRDVCNFSSPNLSIFRGPFPIASHLTAGSTNTEGSHGQTTASHGSYDLCLFGGIMWPSQTACVADLQAAWEILREGGELVISTVTVDRHLDRERREHPLLQDTGLSDAMYIEDLRQCAKQVGFLEPRLLMVRPLDMSSPTSTTEHSSGGSDDVQQGGLSSQKLQLAAADTATAPRAAMPQAAGHPVQQQQQQPAQAAHYTSMDRVAQAFDMARSTFMHTAAAGTQGPSSGGASADELTAEDLRGRLSLPAGVLAHQRPSSQPAEEHLPDLHGVLPLAPLSQHEPSTTLPWVNPAAVGALPPGASQARALASTLAGPTAQQQQQPQQQERVSPTSGLAGSARSSQHLQQLPQVPEQPESGSEGQSSGGSDKGSSDISMAEMQEVLGEARVHDILMRAFKLPGLLSERCEDYGQSAVYLGTVHGCEDAYTLDMHHSFDTGVPQVVCGNTAAMVGEGGISWLAKHFRVVGDRSVHLGLFSGPALLGSGGGGGRCCG